MKKGQNFDCYWDIVGQFHSYAIIRLMYPDNKTKNMLELALKKYTVKWANWLWVCDKSEVDMKAYRRSDT